MKIEMDFPDIKIDDKWIEKLNLPKVMAQEVQTTRTRLLTNLNQGQNAEGGGLRAYSPGYAKFKQASGRSTVPNLNWTGELHRSMQATVPKSLEDEAKIQFQGTHKGGFSNAGLASTLYARGFAGWFQFGSVDLKRIQESVMKAIDKNISKLLDIK